MIYDLSSSDAQVAVLGNCTKWQTAQAASPTSVARVGEIDRLQFPLMLILRASDWTSRSVLRDQLRGFGVANRRMNNLIRSPVSDPLEILCGVRGVAREGGEQL